MSYWRQYWANLTDGGHRSQDEEFLQKEAKEKLFHLDGGRSLLDFGCGSADLLSYFAEVYPVAVGVDFSESMLEQARKRLEAQGVADRVTLIHADDATVWSKLPPSARFDRVTAVGVVAYFDMNRLEGFIREAPGRLNPGGKLILFDVIDPRLIFLRRLRVLGKTGEPQPSWLRIIKRALRTKKRALLNRLKGLPPHEIGNAHHPTTIEEIARRNGLGVEFVSSMYYNYRYHAILAGTTKAGE